MIAMKAAMDPKHSVKVASHNAFNGNCGVGQGAYSQSHVTFGNVRTEEAQNSDGVPKTKWNSKYTMSTIWLHRYCNVERNVILSTIQIFRSANNHFSTEMAQSCPCRSIMSIMQLATPLSIHQISKGVRWMEKKENSKPKRIQLFNIFEWRNEDGPKQNGRGVFNPRSHTMC